MLRQSHLDRIRGREARKETLHEAEDRCRPVTELLRRDTQIQDEDLFDFDYEVEPLLQVLCGKTLEISRAEVLQEEELKVLKQKQKFLAAENDKEAKKIGGLEEKEKQLREQNVSCL